MAVSRKKKIKGLDRDVQSLLLLIWSLSFASNFKACSRPKQCQNLADLWRNRLMFKVIFKGLIKINAQTIDTGTLPYKFSIPRLIFAEEGNK